MCRSFSKLQQCTGSERDRCRHKAYKLVTGAQRMSVGRSLSGWSVEMKVSRQSVLIALQKAADTTGEQQGKPQSFQDEEACECKQFTAQMQATQQYGRTRMNTVTMDRICHIHAPCNADSTNA